LFCIPWGRYFVEKIIEAVLFVVNNCGSFVAAALNLGENTDARTVIRYHSRILSRIPEWIPLLTVFLTSELGAVYRTKYTPTAEKNEFLIAWFHLSKLIDSICDRLEILPGSGRPSEPLGFALSVIGYRTKALGP
jgi:hypothetical protein